MAKVSTITCSRTNDIYSLTKRNQNLVLSKCCTFPLQTYTASEGNESVQGWFLILDLMDDVAHKDYDALASAKTN